MHQPGAPASAVLLGQHRASLEGPDGARFLVDLPAAVSVVVDAQGKPTASALLLPPDLARRVEARVLDVVGLAREGALGPDGRVAVIVRAPGALARVPGLVEDARALPTLGLVTGRVALVSLPALAALPGVERVFLDARYETMLAESVPQVRADLVHRERDALGAPVDGRGVTIAIVDTGVDWTHADLGGCLGAGCKVVGGWDHIGNDPLPMDEHGHGTHVAATAAGAHGVARGASILAYRVCADRGCPGSAIVAAIENATVAGAGVISISLGGRGTSDGPLATAVDAAVRAGAVVVSAAGNGGRGGDFTVGEPAASLLGIAVGATDKGGALASFSSRGPVVDAAGNVTGVKPDLVAPGVGIVAAVPTGGCELCHPSGARSLSGTSMAAPHVSGAAALLRQAHPAWTAGDVKAALVSTARPAGLAVREEGTGLLDAHAAWGAGVVLSHETAFVGQLAHDAVGLDVELPVLARNLGAQAASFEVRVEGLPADPVPVTLAPGASALVPLSLHVADAASLPVWTDVAATAGAGSLARATLMKFVGLEFRLPESALALLVHLPDGGQHVVWFPGQKVRYLTGPGTYSAFTEAADCTFDADFCDRGVYVIAAVNVTVDDVASVDLRPRASLHTIRVAPVDQARQPYDAVSSCGEWTTTDCWSDFRTYTILATHGGLVSMGAMRVPERRVSSLPESYILGAHQGYRHLGTSLDFAGATRGVSRDLVWQPGSWQEYGVRYNLPADVASAVRHEDCVGFAGYINFDQRRVADGERERFLFSFDTRERWMASPDWHFDLEIQPCAYTTLDLWDPAHEWYEQAWLGGSDLLRHDQRGARLVADYVFDEEWAYDDRFVKAGADFHLLDGAPFLAGHLLSQSIGNGTTVGVFGAGRWPFAPFGAGGGGMLHRGQPFGEPALRLRAWLDGEEFLDASWKTHQLAQWSVPGEGNVTAELTYEGGYLQDRATHVSYTGSWHTDQVRSHAPSPEIRWVRVLGNDAMGTRFAPQTPITIKLALAQEGRDGLPERVRLFVSGLASTTCFEHPAPEGSPCAPFAADPPAPPDETSPLAQLLRALGLVPPPPPPEHPDLPPVLTARMADPGPGAYAIVVEAWTQEGRYAKLEQRPAYVVG